MDTSKEYVKMCEKAVEVQELQPKRRIDDPQSFYKHLPQIEEKEIEIKAEHPNAGLPDKCVWLPRQDQLQGILGDHIILWKYIIKWSGLSRWELIYEERKNWYVFGQTMEQLWLAFVMKEKFNKTWNGKDWLTA